MLPVYGWAVRPDVARRSGLPVCPTSLCTLAVVPDSVGTVSTSPVGGRRPLDPSDTTGMVMPSPVDEGPLDPSDTTGMVLPSPVDEGPLPWHHAVPLSGHHVERSPRPATRS